MKKSNGKRKSIFSIFVIISLLLAGTLLAQNNSKIFSIFTGNFASPTPTPQTVRPKRKTTKTETRQESKNEQTTPTEQSSANLSQILASADFNLIGLIGTVNPTTQTVPKNIPTAVLTSIQVPEGTDTAPIIAQLNPNYRIRGELSGPSFTAPRIVEARIGQPLQIPPMPNVGDHVLQNLRIVDSTDATNTTLAPVTPDSVGITVIDNILVTQVQVTEMTYEQIIQSGINLNDSNYTFYNFVIGLGTSSGTVPIQIPVALPNSSGQVPVVGNPTGGVSVGGVSVPIPDVVPVMLEGVDEEGNPTPIEMPGGGTMQIPGVVVFPGRIGLLNQFFEAIVIVANGAPNGTPLVITNLRARANLPDAGTPNDATDDPLRIAATQQGGVQSQLEIHGLGPDGRYGTADDTTSFNPGQSGQAAFLLEGLREGLHTVDFDLEGTLQGLPSGNVTIRGSVPGAVLVRDAEFGVTFTHPAVVRAGQEYDLGLTVFNSGTRNLNGIALSLRGDSVSGATLIDSETKTLNQTISPGSSGTVKWRLRSNTTGQVTASYIKVGEGIDAGLNLVTGVGDRNVPLSPDSLILPDAVRHLPPDVVEAARQMLGQSWSVATAPSGSLPTGVLPIDKQTVISKAIELGWAGLRIDFHESRDTSLRTLLRDWLGENQTNSSAGFADALRNTTAGFYFFDVVGTKFFESVGTESPTDFHRKLATAESSRSSFISAFVSQASGQQILGAKINSPTNQSVGFGANANQRFGDLRTGASLNLLETDPHSATNTTKGNLLIVSKPTTSGNWSLEINGWQSGNADISILAPTSGKNYRQIIFGGVPITAGKRYRISFRASGTTAPVVEEFINGAFRSATLPFTISDVTDPNPEITGVVQVTEDVIEGGDKYGRLVGVLFSKPMVKTSVETITRYQIGGGGLVSNPSQIVGKLIKPTGAAQNFGNRFSILALDSPVGPYIKRTLSANGTVDVSGKIVSNSTRDIEARVSPQGNPAGGYLTGRVMQADGTPVPNANIFYRRMKEGFIGGMATPPCGLFSNWETVSYQKADANGEFAIDYVREGECHPVTVLFQNTATNSEKTLVSNVAYNGQHLIFNAVFLARGNVQGTVTSGGVPLANANVSILSELDPLNNKLVKTNAQGFYSATGVPVGGLTVKAVGTGAYSLSSGIAAGNLGEAGATATINVTTQNVSGIIRGRVLDSGSGQTPVPNSLVVAKANIPGFPSINGPIPVGYAFTAQDGSFTIDRLPIGNVYLEATDPQRGISTSTTVSLTPQNTNIEGVILLVSNGFGRVLGKVVNEIGQIIPNAVVREGNQAVQADSSGNYVLQQIREGNVSISATDPITNHNGSTTVSVRRNEDTTGADIVIRRPANLNGQVFITQNGTTTPLAQAFVSADGRRVVRTDSNGRYTLNDVESGVNLTIRFVHPQGRLFVNTNVFLNPGETLSRNATFRPGRIHGRITQPDGITPVVTGVNFTTSKPTLTTGAYFGLPEEVSFTYQTTTNGLYSFENLNPINYRVSTSNVFFPITVSQAGILPPSGDLEINLSLVDSLAGRIHGHIYQPDGITPVGAGVKVSLGGGSLSDVNVRTNASGYYEFAEVFAEGGYILTATDLATNRTNRTGVSIQRNQDIEVDLRLLGRGNLRVRVIDGGGNPLQNGSIRVEGSNYPNDQRYIELTPSNNGEFEFTNLTEGNYAVSALYQSLGGRVSGTVTIGGTTVVTIQIQAVGSVTGRVFMPNGTTPVGLADVTLRQNGRIIGLITTQDSEEERGKFDFAYVPTGDFTIDVFDNRTGRNGRSAGTITAQGQVANVNVNLLALGTVVGQVTSNGVPAEHALVNLSADGSGISGTSRVATTDANGNFRFPGIPVGQVYISATNSNGLTGQAQGFVIGTNEPLPDTIINVALTPTASVTGTIYKFGGAETYSGALVRVSSNNFSVNTVTDANGRYRLDFVPLGTINVKVESPFGYDRGKSLPIISNQAGATVTADVTMSGVGNINGTALGSNGNPLSFGQVTFTNTAWGENITVVAPVQSNGTYSMSGLPTGDFNLKLTVPQIVGVGTAADNLAGGQTLVKNLQLEQAGKVFGNVKLTDGTTPSIGADVTLSLSKQGGGFYTFITHTDSSGNWTIDNLPLGTISVRISDVNSGGVANISGLILNANGQELDAGNVILDNTPISIVSVTPANNAANVAINSTVNIVFSEPVDANTIHSGSVRLKLGNNSVSASQTISPDGTTVTLTPSQLLAETQSYNIVVTTQVKDRNGLALAQEFSSTFTTADQTPPTVSTISPANSSTEILLNSKVTITASEILDNTQDLSNLIQVSTNNIAVVGTTTLDQTGRILEFTPTANLSDSSIYNVTVNNLKDSGGNTQTTAFNSIFRTKDLTAPLVNPLPIDGTTIRTFTPTITATYSDNFSGINTSSVILTIDGTTISSGATVTGGSLSYTPTANLTRGVHNISVQVTDNVGNVSVLRTASFTIDDSGPIITSFTIGGTPATNGAQISSSLTPLFDVNYTDDTGINASTTKLYLGFNGATPTEVNATITNTRLTYQSPTPMTEGNYVVRAVITNNLGTFTDTGNISFTLDVDAPEIQSVTPDSGNQHGGTTVVLSGLRLLNLNNTAPIVTIGNLPATVTNISATTPNQVTIVTPAGIPGGAIIEITTDRGIGTATFNYQADPRTPFAVETDTKLLWHLDETGNGYFNATDASPFGLHGTSANGALLSTSGRFANGRTSTSGERYLYTVNPFGLLNFASTGFTLETWIKTPQVSSQKRFLHLSNDYYGEVGTFYIENSGAITGRIFSTNGTQWNISMPANVFDVDNNQWHQLNFVLDVTENKLKLYIDGELRAESTKPANFDVMRDHPNYSTRFFALMNDNLTLDEIRASNSAHSAQQILNTYLGTEGNLQTTVYNGNSAIIYPRGTQNNLLLSGFNLAGITATAVDSAGNAVQTQVISSSATSANLRITVGNEAALGNAQITITSPTNSVTIPFRITDLTRIVPSVEQDTRLLWHLDETGNGYFNATDASPFGLHGTSANGALLSTSGRFANGRTSTSGERYLYTVNPFGLLNFASSGFTLETWIKTPQVSSQKRFLHLSNDYYGEVGTVSFESSRAVTAKIFSTNGTPWSVVMPAGVYDLDNNQWHQVSLVLNLAENKLKLYIDGELRAESTKPANFDVMRDHPSYSTRFFALMNDNLTLDEVKVSATPHSAETIRQDFLGESGMRITSTDYTEISRNSSTITNQEFNLFGYNLENVTAQVVKNGQPINVGVNLISSSFREAKLNLAVQTDTPLGAAQIVISKPNHPNSTINIKIVEKNPFVADVDTVLLWHLDETGSGYFDATDAGALGLHGTSANGALLSTNGRFSNGRTSTSGERFLYTVNPFGALNFGANSLTMETWVKTPQVDGQKRLLNLTNDYYGEVGTLFIESSGGLSGRMYAANGTQWNIAMSPLSVDFDNNQWHHIAWVIDRTENKMKLYVDGELRAEAIKPTNFDALRDHPNYSTRFATFLNQNLVMDEVRISSTALTAQRISDAYYGIDQFRIYRTYPYIVQRNETSQVFITGFGLNDVNVTTNRADVNINVVSATLSQLELAVTPTSSATLGEVQINLTKPSGTSLTTTLSVVDQRPYLPALDTVLLWHLDETGNGYFDATDSGALGLHGTSANGALLSTNGRFSNGRTSTSGERYLYTVNPFGALNFGANSLTMETWVKTPQVDGQKRLLNLTNDYYGEVGTLQIEASGALSARFYSPNGTLWSVAVPRNYNPQTGFWQGRVDDNYWHHVAVVIDRTENKLKIYVDGQLRAEAAKPTNFDTLRDHPNYSTRFATFLNQNLVMDEVRVSATAFSDARVTESYYGFDQFRLYRTYPNVAQRGTTTPMFISGYGLNDVSVTTNRADVVVNVVSATTSQLELSVEPILTAMPGNLQLTLTKPSGEFLNTNITIVNQQPFANNESGTKLLWHLDETGSGYFNATDSGALGLHGTSANGALLSTNGRFSNGRTSTSGERYLYTVNPFGALNFGANSLTMETWVKTPQVDGQKRLLNLTNDYYGEVGTLQIEASGALSARFYSPNGTLWSVAVPRNYNPQTGFWQGRVDDNYWHYVVLVLDRTENKLKIYIDGELRAEAAKPTNFDTLRDHPSYSTRFATFLNQNVVSDETRILDFPRTSQQILETWIGNANNFGLGKANPQNQIVGKENKPENSPSKPTNKPILTDMPPKETVRKGESQKEERK